MEKLGTYELTGHLTSQNSGYSVWGFGKKNERDFFIKQFLSPKFPENDTVSSPESLARKRKKCARFEEKKAALYKKINENSDGNAVRVEEFFRIETKYYITMRKIEALPWEVEHVAALPLEQKKFLCGIIAHGIAGLHRGRVVHADLKHDNILYMVAPSGNITAKIIDFDSGFLETDPPTDGEEIVGDQVYFSPEACLTFMGETPELTCKMDIFALGVLFHQYFAGDLPGFDGELGSCAGEAVARGSEVAVSEAIPGDVRELLISMLSADPHARPTALEVYANLMGKSMEQVQKETNKVARMPAAAPIPKIEETTVGGNPFFTPGDL